MSKADELKPYQPNLRRLLHATKPEGVVLNQTFAKWEDLIAENMHSRKHSARYKYFGEEDRGLFKAVEKHLFQYRFPVAQENIVLLVHPFYLPMTNAPQLRGLEELQEETDAYLKRLINFFHWLQRTKTAGSVVLETLHHYAAATSLLLEQGLLDSALISEYNTGMPIDSREFNRFKGKRIFAGGGYNDGCLRPVLETLLREYSVDLYVIHDLTIEPPSRMDDSIHPKTVYTSSRNTLPQKRCLTTEEVKARLMRI
ncbi:hypothetical protein HYT55_03785 [Candidatus Woesearchaeota archaeon]|nr:hypothetical protein [Candidatus Woesearchaeota archaeon]